MIIFAPKETDSSETRAALTPTTVKRLVDIGLEVEVESGIGAGCDHSDIEYSESGAKIVTDKGSSLSNADFIFRVRKPPSEEISILKQGAMHLSFLDPFNHSAPLHAMGSCVITAVIL